MLAYHPRYVTLTGQEAKGLPGRDGGATVDSLLASFVLLGLPARFSRDLFQAAPKPPD
jgi:hypothetical protein